MIKKLSKSFYLLNQRIPILLTGNLNNALDLLRSPTTWSLLSINRYLEGTAFSGQSVSNIYRGRSSGLDEELSQDFEMREVIYCEQNSRHLIDL